MKRYLQLLIAVLTLVSAALPCRAQADDASEPKFFRLDFTIKELESGKLINSRNYSMTIWIDKSSSSSIRSGEKVPFVSGKSGGDDHYQYQEFGVNIDCRSPRVVANQLSTWIVVDISGAGINEKPIALPLIRSTKWSATVVVPFRKTTMLFSSDDPSSKHQMQLELTATPIKL